MGHKKQNQTGFFETKMNGHESIEQHIWGNLLSAQVQNQPGRNHPHLCPYYGKRLDISLKRNITDKNWHAGKGMAKGSREEIVKLNNYLEKFRSSIVECYQELHLQKKLITVEIIKEKIFGNDQQDYTLCKLISYHNTGQIGILAT